MQKASKVLITIILMVAACSKLPVTSQPDFSQLPIDLPPRNSQLPTRIAQNFSLLFEWNTGTLPPEYTYSYTIMLETGKGRLEYQHGYADDYSKQWKFDFTVSEKQMYDLYEYLNSQNMFRSSWKKGEPMLGGSGSALILKADGEEYIIPSISILASSEYARVDAAFEAIRALVPQSIWDEMNAHQREYEANFEE